MGKKTRANYNVSRIYPKTRQVKGEEDERHEKRNDCCQVHIASTSKRSVERHVHKFRIGQASAQHVVIQTTIPAIERDAKELKTLADDDVLRLTNDVFEVAGASGPLKTAASPFIRVVADAEIDCFRAIARRLPNPTLSLL